MRSFRHYVSLVEYKTDKSLERLVRKAARELLYMLSNSGGDYVDDMKPREQMRWAVDRCYDAYSDIEWHGRSGRIPVWRVITAPIDWKPGAQPLGYYWSWVEDAAEAHWGDFSTGDVEWIMHGEIAVKDVDWADTIAKNAHPDYEDEKEISLREGRKVFLKWYQQKDDPSTKVDVNQVMETLTEAPLDRSHAARLQRAREQGFNIDEPHYHGTPGGDFDEFDPERTADEDLAYGKGVYASRDPDAASGYSRPGSSWGNDGTDDARPTVYKVYMKVKKPFDLDAVYPYAEVKRIFQHCFSEDELEGIELWTDIEEDARFSGGTEELNELEERLMDLEGQTQHEDIDPDDYEEGRKDPEYIADVDHALDVEEKSIKRQIAFVTRRVEQEFADHQAALANGRTGGAYGRDIYKALWTNTSEYHDWKAESKLFGGETDTFEFKTEANAWLEELGYDGITHTDNYNPGKKGKAHKVTIAFRPEQVRSAHAMFDPEKANSRKMHESVEGPYPPDEKFHGPVPEIKYLPVRVIHRREMDFRPEVLTVSDKVAANMDFSEPVEVTAFRFGPNNDEQEPAVTVTDGHHRTAAAIQTGKPYLPVTVRSVNAKGRKLNALIALSRKIEASL